MSHGSKIAIIGGTGKEGKGLAYCWARAGHTVLIGSRSAERAQGAAQEVIARLGSNPGQTSVMGLDNAAAAGQAEIIVLTVPYAAHRTTLEQIRDSVQGKLVIDVTVPLVPPKVSLVKMPPAGSAALEAREILGEGVEIADAFQNVSHEVLAGEATADCDVLVTGSSKEARARALELVAAAGLSGWDAGPLENSVVVEGLTSVLIHINRKYGSTHAGIRITGVSAGEAASPPSRHDAMDRSATASS
jgi:NADPH-dependent F420 reductase